MSRTPGGREANLRHDFRARVSLGRMQPPTQAQGVTLPGAISDVSMTVIILLSGSTNPPSEDETMPEEAWITAIKLWRALPEEEKARRRWANIPRSVAASMAFAGQPVSLAVLEAEHAKRPMPSVRPRGTGSGMDAVQQSCSGPREHICRLNVDEVQLMEYENAIDERFTALTGNPPFPWQRALFERFCATDPTDRFPSTCDIPTGLGKTSVIAVWLLALAHHARQGSVGTFPRRLVYVVNRRTVVDQSTREAELLRKNLAKPELRDVAEALGGLASQSFESPLAISTLRGQFADNAEWRDDPARAAVVVGTVDMIGSRLLFSGYGRGFKSKPLHAALLGQDALLVHDEAHLESAFQCLIEAVHAEQQRNAWERGRFHVMALSATARSSAKPHSITDDDLKDPVVRERVHAKKAITFHDVDEKMVADRILEIAQQERFKDSGRTILIFVRQVKDALDISTKLSKARQKVQTLTGTLRGYERDQLVNDEIFARFLPRSDARTDGRMAEGTVYLVCTSAGEVGVNISADHLICDLSPFDSMAQRLGRVHRFGLPREHTASVEIVATTAEPKPDDLLGQRIGLTRRLLEKLDGDASPAALRQLPAEERLAAFSPQPMILPVGDILFDAWALTTIREPLPGRPSVAEYLHGVSEYEPPTTEVAWRQEVQTLVDHSEHYSESELSELLEDFPLKAHETLQDRTDRVADELVKIAERHPDDHVWIVDRHGRVRVQTLSKATSEQDKKRRVASLADCTVLLSPRAGGLSKGMLSGREPYAESERYDVADQWLDEHGRPRRGRTFEGVPRGMRIVRAIDLSQAPEIESDDTDKPKVWTWYVDPKSADDDGSRSARAAELLTDHLGKAAKHAAGIARKLVAPHYADAITKAAAWHDLGKRRRVWQRSIGNLKPEVLAKSGPGMKPREITAYRHEFGSLLDVAHEPEFQTLSPEAQDLVLHTIASHHGRARPHFPLEEAFDPERPTSRSIDVAREVPRRFARLQAHFGRWGLAYLESLVRTADALASQDIATSSEWREAAE